MFGDELAIFDGDSNRSRIIIGVFILSVCVEVISLK
jgi:hypothetical protein